MLIFPVNGLLFSFSLVSPFHYLPVTLGWTIEITVLRILFIKKKKKMSYNNIKHIFYPLIKNPLLTEWRCSSIFKTHMEIESTLLYKKNIFIIKMFKNIFLNKIILLSIICLHLLCTSEFQYNIHWAGNFYTFLGSS